MIWKKQSKFTWRNDKSGRWVGIQKVGKIYRSWTIKNGYITHGDFSTKKLALVQVKKFKKL